MSDFDVWGKYDAPNEGRNIQRGRSVSILVFDISSPRPSWTTFEVGGEGEETFGVGLECGGEGIVEGVACHCGGCGEKG